MVRRAYQLYSQVCAFENLVWATWDRLPLLVDTVECDTQSRYVVIVGEHVVAL